MENKDLYQKAEKAINQAFDVAKQSIKVVSEKAGEAAQMTSLLIEKTTLEHRVSKKFAALGSRVYEQMVKEGKTSLEGDTETAAIIEETKKLDADLAKVEASIDKERSKKAAK